MKKLLSVLLVALFAMSTNAQLIYRSGDKYFADGQPMNKQMFASYMQQNAEAQLAQQFRSVSPWLMLVGVCSEAVWLWDWQVI